ncbi:zinc finger protein 846-like [Patiria miniata]|uniref:C2H2-type domain-containing protein n=1 Tax=Patiria miniata TaxID=46514 RepID=A0A914B8R1_PATMI|nr:zinc finger protein 846-like [Patiria miniata]XP_038072374.1 zinc finger protein 846-like [Patiria miniata]XP_038072375.1 zinc finger protein 846-like [Patiria miniata]XP_038072376.1 zinc finger protein 846-like [Patiria miniata]
MEVASGSMILHPDLAEELRALLESSGFETAGSFLKHLFALEEQHRSQKNLSTGMEWGGDLNINQDVNLVSAQPPETASIGVQAKLCSCSDKVIVKTLRERSAVRLFDKIQRGNFRDETSDSEGVDQSDSDYSEEMEEEVNYNSRKRKQKSKTVKGKPKHKTVPKQKTKRRKDEQEAATVSQPNTKRRKPDEGTESVSKQKKKTKKSKDEAKTDAKPTENEKQSVKTCKECDAKFTNKFDYNQHVKKHSEESLESLNLGRMVHIVRIQERPLVCKQCGKAYRTARGLQYHTYNHTGERPYKCTQCDNAYKSGQSLREHVLRYHEQPGIKPYKCPYCDKSFVKQHTLNVHKREKHQSPDEDQ